jgi:cyclic beta-1,2-glucan synthetase
VVFLLGQAEHAEEARAIITRYRAANLDEDEADVAAHWERMLGSVQVKTPDRAMDIMLNGWLMYQTIACRLWARSGFYQSSGAYGFRDQLQDGMALAAVQPHMTRSTSAAGGGTPVRRRRCSALVAAAFRPGGAHPHLG